MNDYMNKGYAEKLTLQEIAQRSLRTWYIPHHGVTNPKKPGKARYTDTSRNENLMSKPDLLKSLFGVVKRFCIYFVALIAHIESMFHQVKIAREDSDSLRFLWKEDLNKVGQPDIIE